MLVIAFTAANRTVRLVDEQDERVTLRATWYSFGTILTLVVFGAVTSLYIPRIWGERAGVLPI